MAVPVAQVGNITTVGVTHANFAVRASIVAVVVAISAKRVRLPAEVREGRGLAIRYQSTVSAHGRHVN